MINKIEIITTVIDYIENYLSEKLDLTFIAGYESQQAFTTVFKQMYKKSPNEYRTDKEFYPLQLRFILKKELSQTALPDDIKTKITLATISDIPPVARFSQANH